MRRTVSPEASAIIATLSLSRRTLMRGTLASSALVAAGGALAACGTKGQTQTAESCVSEDLSGTEKTLAFSNWPLYIDVDENDESKRPTLDAFTAKSGIAVTYTEDINDNNEFFGKVQNQLAGCQSTGRDLIVLTDWMAARLNRLGWLQKLDRAKMPAVEKKNLLAALRNRSFDPAGEYSVPWQAGLTGIAYNGDVTGELRTVDELLTRPDLKGKVTALARCATRSACCSSRTGTTRRTSPPRSSTTRSPSCRRR